MKHTTYVTFILTFFFIVTQIVGIIVASQYISVVDGALVYGMLPFNAERPQLEESTSYMFIVIAMLVATGLFLLIIKFGLKFIWKMWFFLAVSMCLIMAFGAFINENIALVLALLLAWIKIWKPNFYVHNFTEIFIYAGLGALLIPVINLSSAALLLILIAIYDMYAVWKSGHMVTMAKFLSNSGTFAGLFVPYNSKTSKIGTKIVPTNLSSKSSSKTSNEKTAILGGGDMALPLLFAGAALKSFLLDGSSLIYVKVGIISLSASVSLFLLLYHSEKNKFYPAVPFLTAGCFVGYGIVYLLF